MTTWISGVCETNGINLHYLRTGRAKDPVVLLHGLTGSSACWTPLARTLESEFDVVMPDARGHGGSSAPHHGYRYDDHASDVLGLIRGLELSRPVLLGHSMGGMTAAVVASRGDPRPHPGRPDVLEPRAATRGARQRRRRSAPPRPRLTEV